MIDRDSLLLAGFTDAEIRAMVRQVRQSRDFQADLRLPKVNRKNQPNWNCIRFPRKAPPLAPTPRIEPDRRTHGAILPSGYGLRRDRHCPGLQDIAQAIRRATILQCWRDSRRRSVSRDLADTSATIALSELGDLQESHLRYIRSLKRAETLLDALLAPCIREACQTDYLPPHPHPKPHWAQWMNDGPNSLRLRVMPIPKQRKPKRKCKPAHQPSPLPLCGPHPSDYRRADGLAAARVLVAETIAQRNAQASYRPFSRENLDQWRESAAIRSLPESLPVPANDTAQDCLTEHWAEVASGWINGDSPLPDSMPLPAPTHEAPEATAPIEIPADWPLSPALRLIAGLLAAGASDREIARQCYIDRRDIPAIAELIRSKIPAPLPPVPRDDEPSPSHRRAIQREAVAQLRR